jgi:glycosidase
MTLESRIADHLAFLYGVGRAPAVLARLREVLAQFRWRTSVHAPSTCPVPQERLSERDVILITYGDQVTEAGKSPLLTLAEVLETTVGGAITGVHILPFFPYSSDDGFSIIDYAIVDPALGTWADIERLGCEFRLMFDAVINHISAQSRWFQEFLWCNPEFADFFIVVEEGTDLSQVVRPRALPLLTRVQTAHGERLVWTTFSADQIDLNYANPDVLLRIVEILLLYVEKGAQIIRLDAIAYLWKKIGTPCIHLEETHRVIKFLRAVLDAVAPHVILITETNVPHEENVSYYGDGSDEAQMVYQFSLPPLVLHTFHTGDASRLSEWAGGLNAPSSSTTFFNFLASHDGVGVRPVEGILSHSEVQAMVERTLAHGGYVSYKAEHDGSQTVYELNISYFDALSDPHAAEPLDLQVWRFLASQAIMLSLAGVPGIYVHSVFGSRSYRAGVEQTGRYRSINREKLHRDRLEREVADPASLRHKVLYPYLHIIRTRAAHPAFHPAGSQQVLSLDPALFVLLRGAPDGSESLLCIHNVSSAERLLRVDLDALAFSNAGHVRDLIAGAIFRVDTLGTLNLCIAPYQVLWLTGNGNVTWSPSGLTP